MATLTVTMAAGSETGAILRKLENVIESAAAGIPDRVPTGASTTFVIDNAPSTGTVSVQVTGGPYTSALFLV
jgi:hypothetical protein